VKIDIVNGIYTDANADFRTSYPVNLVPVPKQTGINEGYLKPSDGLEVFATGPGTGRGGIAWRGECYRVMGTKLVRVASDGTVTEVGDVGGSGYVSMTYSFDRIGIASNGKLFYYDGNSLTQVTDADIGIVLYVTWLAGYFITTDGTSIIVTELNDPTQVNPLKYGSSEVDPDEIKCLLTLRNELVAVNRYTTETFRNVGGDNFPFSRIDGAMIPVGAIGRDTACTFSDDNMAILGSGRNQPPAVYLGQNGTTQKISTREIDQVLLSYTEAQLSGCKIEVRKEKSHLNLFVHLPDMTYVYDDAASRAIGEPVWYKLVSSVAVDAPYRARSFVWCYDRWLFDDPLSSNIGTNTLSVSSHYGQKIGWEFGTKMLYNEGNGGQVHSLELICLTGRVLLGDNPVVWTSYSTGTTFSVEKARSAGKQGEYDKRIIWRKQGLIRQRRMQRFRGTSDAHLTIARLEAKIEGLYV
jgi:hypothetical protein